MGQITRKPFLCGVGVEPLEKIARKSANVVMSELAFVSRVIVGDQRRHGKSPVACVPLSVASPGDKSGDDRDTRRKAFKLSGRHNPNCEAPRLSGAAGVKSYITLHQL